MEKIITHYAGNISFDSETLKAMAESVDKNPDAPRSHRQNQVVASPGSDYLGVDDENFTVQPLDNNTTRKNPSPIAPRSSSSALINTCHRLLW